MIKLRRLRIRRRLASLRCCLLRSRRGCRPRRASYLRLDLDQSPQRQPTRDGTIAGKLLSWTRRLCPLPFRSRAEATAPKPYRDQAPVKPPKGHLVVYVGREKRGSAEVGVGQSREPRRVVVPVVYFNHPLFAELLREAEQVYGFRHQGGIMLPCSYSNFESVRTRVAAAASAGLCCRDRGGAKRRWPLGWRSAV